MRYTAERILAGEAYPKLCERTHCFVAETSEGRARIIEQGEGCVKLYKHEPDVMHHQGFD